MDFFKIKLAVLKNNVVYIKKITRPQKSGDSSKLLRNIFLDIFN